MQSSAVSSRMASADQLAKDQLQSRSTGKSTAVYVVLGIFAALLALITSRHEMYLDEVQPWLFVRNAHSLLPVIQHLRYESHPALWFVLLYLASRISSSVVMMQCVNFVLAISMAWSVLSSRSLSMAVRVLIVFGVSVFFVSGVLARDYMLAGLLLILASRCLLARPKRHWLGMVLISLAINAHFLAIPVAFSILIWLYLLAPESDLASVRSKFRERRFWASVSLITVALIACFFTVRPAKDMSMRLGFSGGNLFEYLVLAVGRVWHYFLPISLDTSSSIRNGALALPAYSDALITLVLFSVAIAILPGKTSRYFMIMASVLWTAAAVATVRVPLETHSTFIIFSYIIALLASKEDGPSRPLLPQYIAEPMLLVLLAIQVSICAEFCIKEWTSPFSAGKAVAQWLKVSGLVGHPLVVQSELPAPAVLAYTGIPTAYFPACRCNRPYVLYNTGWDDERTVSREELDSLLISTGESPIVLSQWQIAPEEQHRLGLHLAYVSPKGWGFSNEDVSVYVVSNVHGGY